MRVHGAMQRERYGVEETRRARAYGSRMCTVTGMQSHSGGGVMSVEREAKRACGLGKREEMEMGRKGVAALSQCPRGKSLQCKGKGECPERRRGERMVDEPRSPLPRRVSLSPAYF